MRKALYIGANEQSIAHFNQILDEQMVVFPELKAASGYLSGRESLVVFFEKNDQIDVAGLKALKAATKGYFILVTGHLTDEERKLYLQAGVGNAISPGIAKADLDRILRFIVDNHAGPLASASGNSRFTPFRTPVGKRMFDVVFSVMALIVLSPFLLLVALLIKLGSKGPVIYKSKRVGSNYQVFDLLKFRSMYIDADERLEQFRLENLYDSKGKVSDQSQQLRSESGSEMNDVMLVCDDFVISEQQYNAKNTLKVEDELLNSEDDPRITGIGRFIRKYDIDDLPQFINILKGEMSVVGNRPLPMEEAELLTSDEYIDRFMSPIGLFGLWKAQGGGKKNLRTPEERAVFEMEYAKKYSPWLDLKIIIKALFRV